MTDFSALFMLVVAVSAPEKKNLRWTTVSVMLICEPSSGVFSSAILNFKDRSYIHFM